MDRPDVFSHLAWMAGLWILLLHRRDRGVWMLLPLQVVWVNMHHHFTLLPAAYAAFVIGDFLETGGRGTGRPRGDPADWRRAGLVFGSLLLATCLNPMGPAAWLSQLKLAGVFTGRVSPIPLQEIISPYAAYAPFLALWIFRIGMPLCLAAAILGRKRIGLGALLALLIPAVLAILARRAMSLFSLTAVALVPPALDEIAARLSARAARVCQLGASALTLLVGLVAVVGLANGRIFLAQDKDIRVGAVKPFGFPATAAALCIHEYNIQGPIFHNPTSAGAILMENGTRLNPFLDPRWCGTEDANRVYVQLVRAGDANIKETWSAVQAAHGFETVMLDFYEMPALLRFLAADPGWAMVFLDDSMALFCRRGGKNAGAIARLEPQVAAERAVREPGREEALGREVVRFLASPEPSPLTPLRFPSRSFSRANFALQVGSRPEAQAAYLELYRTQRGSLHASSHRVDILENTLWCLAESDQWEARADLCLVLADRKGIDPARRRGLRLSAAQALLQGGNSVKAERIAASVAADPAAGAEERWTALVYVANAKETGGDHAGALEALHSAAQARPAAAETYRAIGAILDRKLERRDDALAAYETYQRLGGTDSVIARRVREIRSGR